MIRVAGWEQKFIRVTIAAMRRHFAWGDFDCAIFPCDCIMAITGEDLAADFRGRYENEAEAWAFLASLGYRDLGELASSRLPEITIHEVRRGDVVLNPGESGNFLGVCDGITSVGPVDVGLRHWPILMATRAWRVG